MRREDLIAHRGNLYGPSERENEPAYLLAALEQGYSVEADVQGGCDFDLTLGHDRVRYEIPPELLKPNSRVYLHCKGYRAFMHLRRHYPNAHLTCLTGPMFTNSWPAGEERLTKINQWVSGAVERRKAQGDARISFFALAPQTPPFGEDWHPTLDTHARMSRELEGHLREKLGW